MTACVWPRRRAWDGLCSTVALLPTLLAITVGQRILVVHSGGEAWRMRKLQLSGLIMTECGHISAYDILLPQQAPESGMRRGGAAHPIAGARLLPP